jgi:Uncharacterized protein conserved in bacteria (DUF2066)
MIGRAVLLAVLLLALPARAQDVFAVGPVAVDATGESAAAAREEARLDGQREAFQRLVARLTVPADRERVPRVDDAQLNNLIQDFAVANERSSAVRYLADLTFRFRADAVRRLLRGAGVPFAETVSKPLVVLPVFAGEAGPVLWDSPNPWREAWANWRPPGGLVPFIVPFGDLADLAAVDAEQALAGDPAALQRIGRLHRNGDVLVSEARRQGEGVVETTTTRHGVGSEPQGLTQTWRAEGDETEEALLARAVAGVAEAVEEVWKRNNLLQFGQEARLVVAVPLDGIEEWVAIRERLAEIPAVRRAQTLALNREAARVELRYLGDPRQLELALAQRDLELAEGSPDWILRRRAGPTRP